MMCPLICLISISRWFQMQFLLAATVTQFRSDGAVLPGRLRTPGRALSAKTRAGGWRSLVPGSGFSVNLKFLAGEPQTTERNM